MSVETRLHIELSGNVLDVEGDSALMKRIFEDFKQRVDEGAMQHPPAGNAAGYRSGEVAPLVAMTHADIAGDAVLTPDSLDKNAA